MVLAFGLYIIVPLYDFGQREQIALIWALPYAALIARRFSGLPVWVPLATLVGCLAAFGFALKHYFVLAPILLELWLLMGAKRNWRPFRPETVTLAACAVAYAVSIPYSTRSEEHTSALQSLMRISYAVFCLKKKKKYNNIL